MRMYVDVFWLVARVLQLMFMQQDMSCISKSTMEHRQILNLLYISCGYWKCMFVESLFKYTDPPGN